MNSMLEKLDRGLVYVGGEQARPFLQRLLTQDMLKITPERVAYGALLTPQGKVMTDLFIFQEGEHDFFLDVPCGCLEDFMAVLRRYRLRAPVDIENASAERCVAARPLPKDNESEGFEGHAWKEGTRYICYDPRFYKLGQRLVMPANRFEKSTEQGAYQARLFSLGLAEPGVDRPSGYVYPFDVNLDALKALSFEKGCFVGQEVVSRMKRRGRIRKRLLPFDHVGPAPEKGELVNAEGLVVGKLWSSQPQTTGKNRTLVMTRLDRLEKSSSSALFLGESRAFLNWPVWLSRDGQEEKGPAKQDREP